IDNALSVMQQQALVIQAPPTCPIPPAPAYYEDDSALDEPNNRPKLHKKGLSRGEMIRRQRESQRKGGKSDKDTDEEMNRDEQHPRRNLGINRVVQKHLGIGSARKGGGKGFGAAGGARPAFRMSEENSLLLPAPVWYDKGAYLESATSGNKICRNFEARCPQNIRIGGTIGDRGLRTLEGFPLSYILGKWIRAR
ncbi:hypothetical protein FOL47_011228, partial [Perkinsus chesapeaki]